MKYTYWRETKFANENEEKSPIDFARDAGRTEIASYLSSLHPKARQPLLTPICDICQIKIDGIHYYTKHNQSEENVCESCVRNGNSSVAAGELNYWVELLNIQTPIACSDCGSSTVLNLIRGLTDVYYAKDFCEACLVKRFFPDADTEYDGHKFVDGTRELHNGWVETLGDIMQRFCDNCSYESLHSTIHCHCDICGDGDFRLCRHCSMLGIYCFEE
jgi:hypothetical protein